MAVSLKDLANRPADQLLCGDVVCAEMHADEEWSRKQLEERIDFTRWNATSIKNCAFMAIHGPPNHREQYFRLLEEYRDWINAPNGDCAFIISLAALAVATFYFWPLGNG
jgi:hypothetical protein